VERGLHVYDHALFESLRSQDVLGLRIDNLQRADQIRLERDQRGAWFMTEPVAYPANPAQVRKLLVDLSRSRGSLVEGADLADLSLDPPAIVLGVVERAGDGTRTHRVEVGAVDLDPQRIHVRVLGHPATPPGSEGAVLRIPRNLLTSLDLPVADFRERRLSPLVDPRIVAVRREGSVLLSREEGVAELGLDAELIDGRWRTRASPRVSLHPDGIGVLLRAATSLRAYRFIDDAPEELWRYGLEDPVFRLVLVDDRGDEIAFRFGNPALEQPESFAEREWMVMREGFDHVFELGWRDVRTLVHPGALLVDDQLLRAHRKDVLRVELQAQGQETILEQEEEGWWVSREGGLRYPADPGAVEDVLARLEKARIDYDRDGLEVAGADAPASLRILTRDELVWGGQIGARITGEGQGSGHAFRRFGDERVGLVGAEIAVLCGLGPAELRDRVVLELAENLVSGLEVSRGDRRLAYEHVNDGWFQEGRRLGVETRFGLLVDGILHLRAEEWLDGGAQPGELEESVEVRIHGSFGERRVSLGRRADGRVECSDAEGRRALLTEKSGAELMQRLLALFDS
jgi:hypothetical protein